MAGQDDAYETAYFLPDETNYVRKLDFMLFVAVINGEIVGRIGATLNDHFNKWWNTSKQIGFIGFFESIDDERVAEKLFTTAEEWLKTNGVDEVWGPMNFTCYDSIGLLIDGFDIVPTIGMSYNPEYYIDFFNKLGYTKEKDVVELKASKNDAIKKNYFNIVENQKILNENGITIRSLNPDSYEKEVRELYNVFMKSFATH